MAKGFNQSFNDNAHKVMLPDDWRIVAEALEDFAVMQDQAADTTHSDRIRGQRASDIALMVRATFGMDADRRVH